MPNGTVAVFNQPTPMMGRDLLQLALAGTRRVTPLLQTKFDERNGIVSPEAPRVRLLKNRLIR